MAALATAADVDAHMASRSYVAGDGLSAKDIETFGRIGLPDAAKYPNAYRWYVHVAALTGPRILPLVGARGGNCKELDAVFGVATMPPRRASREGPS